MVLDIKHSTVHSLIAVTEKIKKLWMKEKNTYHMRYLGIFKKRSVVLIITFC